ncbi:hypothetical protein [Pseudomonas aeruginosa]|uniref:hypothetical protein n=1 Tax=Pseudomonas aeruginosa TaxID=287 RepID=UPI0007508308|nr:hypothetical protein [Pseudomonas aeruginosa]
MSIQWRVVEGPADLMRSAGYALGVISQLLHENAVRRALEGDMEFLNDYTSGGLLEAVGLIARHLEFEGEGLGEMVEREREKEKTLAERALDKGDDLGRKSRSQCGRAGND